VYRFLFYGKVKPVEKIEDGQESERKRKVSPEGRGLIAQKTLDDVELSEQKKEKNAGWKRI
jgi:hypothetical protein